jgi:hypothetical protein
LPAMRKIADREPPPPPMPMRARVRARASAFAFAPGLALALASALRPTFPSARSTAQTKACHNSHQCSRWPDLTASSAMHRATVPSVSVPSVARPFAPIAPHDDPSIISSTITPAQTPETHKFVPRNSPNGPHHARGGNL